jgi:putative membrane protein
MGQLAQQKGQSEAVKSYGQMLVTDHSAVNQKATDVAKEMGVMPRRQCTTECRSSREPHSIAPFAKEVVADHRKDIREFKKEAKESGPAADFANQTLPTLQKHLEAALNLMRSDTAAR